MAHKKTVPTKVRTVFLCTIVRGFRLWKARLIFLSPPLRGGGGGRVKLMTIKRNFIALGFRLWKARLGRNSTAATE